MSSDLDWNDAFAARLREAMRNSRTGARALATAVGFDVDTVLAWRKGHRLPRLHVFARICEALRVDADWLLGIEHRAPRASDPFSRIWDNEEDAVYDD